MGYGFGSCTMDVHADEEDVLWFSRSPEFVLLCERKENLNVDDQSMESITNNGSDVIFSFILYIGKEGSKNSFIPMPGSMHSV